MRYNLSDVELLFQDNTNWALACLADPYAESKNKLLCEVSKILTNIVKFSETEKQSVVDAASRLALSLRGSADINIIVKICTDRIFYSYQVADYRRGIQYCQVVLELATESGDINIERRAHAAAGLIFTAVCDFDLACFHFDVALTLARQLADKSLECSVLSNIVILLIAMGLYRDATKVALKAISYGSNTGPLAELQLYNALSILKCGQLGRDHTDLRQYYLLACKRNSCPTVYREEVIKAYFEYHRALYLIDMGKVTRACSLVDRAIEKCTNFSNLRIEALLCTAKALCDFARKTPSRTISARRTLRRLTRKTSRLPTHHEDVLCALVKVYAGVILKNGRNLGLEYAHRLRQYILEVKQVKFCSLVGNCSASAVTASPITIEPTETIRRWLATGDDYFGSVEPDSKNSVETAHDQLSLVGEDLARLRTNSVEVELRSGAFDVAENWAVAAEFSLEGTGRHCFRVGKLSSAIALASGYCKEESMQIELATRLHDIGKIAISEMTLRKSALLNDEECFAVMEHTTAGARFLRLSSDATLQRAAVIAESHHEWWNGCGCPHGLRGEEIPIEARICAIADTYDELTNPGPEHAAWSHEAAVRQMLTMGGVQLDPGLVHLFLKVIEKDAGTERRIAEAISKSMELNQLARAKRRLYETLELVE